MRFSAVRRIYLLSLFIVFQHRSYYRGKINVQNISFLTIFHPTRTIYVATKLLGGSWSCLACVEDSVHVKYKVLDALFLIATQDVHSIEQCSRAFVTEFVMYSWVHLATASSFCFCWGVRLGLLWPSGLRAPHIVQTVQTVQCHGSAHIEQFENEKRGYLVISRIHVCSQIHLPVGILRRPMQ